MARQNVRGSNPVGRPDLSVMLAKTTDLALLRRRTSLVLLDEQNLSISAQNLGYHLGYGLLAGRIRSAADAAELHLFIAADGPDHASARRFQALGYIVHVKTVRHIPLPAGRTRRDTNIDNLFAFWAGIHAASSTSDVIVLASGDYGLAGELAQAIRIHRGQHQMQVMTLSLPGSTAQDLDARTNPYIAANLEIGLDVLRPFSSPFTRHCAVTAVRPSSFGRGSSMNPF